LSDLADDAFALAIEAVNQATNHSVAAQTHEMVHEGSSERVDVPPSQLLSEFHAIDRATWVRLVTVLSQRCKERLNVSLSTPLRFAAAPEAFRWTPGFIIGLAVEDPDDEVRNACVSSLISLAELGRQYVPLVVNRTEALLNLDGMRVPLSGYLAGQFNRIAEKGSTNVRTSLATLVGSFAGSEASKRLPSFAFQS
jgi:hypothetical protein